MQAVAHVAIPTDDQEPDPPVRKKKSRRSARDAEIAVAPVVDPEVAPETLEAVVRAEVIEAAELDEPPRKDRTKKKSLEEVAQAVEPEPRRGRKGKRPVEPREVEAEVEVDPEAVEAISSDAPEAEHELEAREGATDEAVAAGEAGDEVALTEGAGVAEGGEVAEGAEGIAGIAGVEATEGVEAAEAPSGAVEGEAEVEGVASLPTSAASLDAEGLKQLVEALVFASDKPMTVQRLRQLTRVSDIPRLEQALVDLAADYADRGIVLQQVSGGYQFRTRTQWSQWVQQLIAGRPVRLTRAQLETLAIVAYRQPITRPEIDDIRGVDSSATLKLLMDRQLIRILGKKEEVGRPMLYGTTKEFLDFFSLGDLRELPTLREYSELTPESRQVITDRLGDLPDDGGEGGEGSSGPLGEGGAGGDPSADASGLGAAPEPTAADLIAAYVAELDADAASAPPHVVLDVVEGDDRAGEPGEDILTYAASSAATDEADGPVADPETIADDAAHLAEAILAMDPPSAATVDASSTGAELASAGLANDAAELADAILGTPAITDELAFDLSDARDGAVEVEVEVAVTELHAGSLVELDPFAAEVPAAVASVGDAFVGESLVGSPELDAPVDPMLADGSSGVAVEAELASAAPHVGLDEWPGGSGGLAASAAHDDAEGELPPLGDSDVDAATAATDGSDVVIDPVE